MNHDAPNLSSIASQALSQALAKAIPPERIAAALSDALSATNITRSGAVEADTRSRLQAASLILAYQVGRPIERSESITVNVDADSDADFKVRLRNSPALRDSLRQMLSEAEQSTIDV